MVDLYYCEPQIYVDTILHLRCYMCNLHMVNFNFMFNFHVLILLPRMSGLLLACPARYH